MSCRQGTILLKSRESLLVYLYPGCLECVCWLWGDTGLTNIPADLCASLLSLFLLFLYVWMDSLVFKLLFFLFFCFM